MGNVDVANKKSGEYHFFFNCSLITCIQFMDVFMHDVAYFAHDNHTPP